MKGKFSYSKTILIGFSALYLGGCSSLSNIIGDGDPVDYRSAKPEDTRRNALQTPPDLRLMGTNNTYQHSQAVSANEYDQKVKTNQSGGVSAQNSDALPTYPNMRIARDGNNMRWLEIDNIQANDLMPKLRRFWEDNGFNVVTFVPAEGLLETDWAENRAKLPQDMLRSLIGSALDTIYSTGELDRFRTRIEPNGKGGVDVFITHQGKEEVLVGSDKSQTKWVTRATDPELEAIFLRRTMQMLGATKEVAQQALNQAQPTSSTVQLLEGQASLLVAEPLDRAWRRVRLGLDRGGFTVIDFNRAEGVFFLRFMGAPDEQEESSFWSGWFGSSEVSPVDLELRLKSADQGLSTRVDVYQSGAPVANKEAQKVVQLLQKQM